MQIVHNGSFYIVDDAYNANIKGVESCCDTLSKFDNYKIVLTQGIVEGGRKQKQFNEQCGKMLGATFDVVIAIGKYAKHISTVAKQGKSQVVVAKNLFEATKLLRNYTKPNCIVVFQNDLPDVVSL
jgi:UDP-N-acetylmuramyl pentapeptide synthase